MYINAKDTNRLKLNFLIQICIKIIFVSITIVH